MAKIRADLDTVVYAYRTNGDVVVLRAGDDIPSDISLGSHLIDSEAKPAEKPVEPKAEAPEPVQAPKRRGRPARAVPSAGD